MSRYYAGNYSRVREEGRTFVRNHYSYTALVKKYYFPAIEAYRRGVRGLYREALSKVICTSSFLRRTHLIVHTVLTHTLMFLTHTHTQTYTHINHHNATMSLPFSQLLSRIPIMYIIV